MANEVLDKNGIAIEEFDVLKVFHFIGPRRKKYYMYKVALLWDGRLYGSHVEENPLTPGYPLWTKPQHHDTEIVQSMNWEKLERKRKGVANQPHPPESEAAKEGKA